MTYPSLHLCRLPAAIYAQYRSGATGSLSVGTKDVECPRSASVR
jgi:hypothetical protein